MPKVKGAALQATVAYLDKTLGKPAARDLLARLEMQDRRAVEGTILHSNWYDLGVLLRLMDAAEGAVEVPAGRSVAWEMGRFSADFGLKTLYRIFIKFADPGFVVRKSTQLYATYYDSGRIALAALDPYEAVVRLTGFEAPSQKLCDRLQGFMERSLELSGAENVLMSHPKCAVGGSNYCEFVAKWE